MTTVKNHPAIPPEQLRRTRQAAKAAFLGSMLEYYDFNVYAAAAAIVFPRIFFPDSDPAISVLLSLATFGVAYIARPIGAIILGHFGDRIGRKKVMLFTLVLMGSATFLIGCLPTYDTVGVLAPIMLVLLRICQGLSAAGEQAGATSLIVEHAPDHQRGYYASWTMSGTIAGQVLGTAVFLPMALMGDALFTWGWRIPFWASIVVVSVAYFVRRHLEEPEAFEDVQEAEKVARFPLLDLIRTQPLALFRLAIMSTSASIGTVFTLFGIAYATTEAGVDRSTMLLVASSAGILSAILIPVYGRTSDRIGRKPVYIFGSLGCAASVFLYFYAISTGNVVMIFLSAFLFFGVCYTAVISMVAFYPEMFATRVRYSGTAVGTQIGYAFAGFVPTIGYAILGTGEFAWIPVAIMTAAIALVVAIAAMTARETSRVSLTSLGGARTAGSVTSAASVVNSVK